MGGRRTREERGVVRTRGGGRTLNLSFFPLRHSSFIPFLVALPLVLLDIPAFRGWTVRLARGGRCERRRGSLSLSGCGRGKAHASDKEGEGVGDALVCLRAVCVRVLLDGTKKEKEAGEDGVEDGLVARSEGAVTGDKGRAAGMTCTPCTRIDPTCIRQHRWEDVVLRPKFSVVRSKRDPC